MSKARVLASLLGTSLIALSGSFIQDSAQAATFQSVDFVILDIPFQVAETFTEPPSRTVIEPPSRADFDLRPFWTLDLPEDAHNQNSPKDADIFFELDFFSFTEELSDGLYEPVMDIEPVVPEMPTALGLSAADSFSYGDFFSFTEELSDGRYEPVMDIEPGVPEAGTALNALEFALQLTSQEVLEFASKLTSQEVPEPGSIAGLLALSGLAFGLQRKSKAVIGN